LWKGYDVRIVKCMTTISKVSFWHDPWCGDKVLKKAFPALYGIVCSKDASVTVHLELFGGSNEWSVSFARAAYDWKVDAFASFFSLLYSVRVRRECEDNLWWAPSKRELLDVRSFYNILVCNDDFFFPLRRVFGGLRFL